MELLSQFLLRLTFGLALGMALTSPRQVSSGYYRNHLYVTLGLSTLAGLVLAKALSLTAWLAILAAVLSFVGAACWLYEAKRAGRLMLWMIAVCALSAAIIGQVGTETLNIFTVWRATTVATSGLVLGLTLAAMLLGHWYLNSPGMSLEPLRRLLASDAIVVSVQAVLSAIGLAYVWTAGPDVTTEWLLFVLLRWSFGLCGLLTLLWMAWRTLEIPNTQSATGILYVAVIGAFVGELTAALLSAESAVPL